MERDFFTLLGDRFAFNRFICVGLDTDYRMIPDWFKKGRTLESAITDYNIRIIEETSHGASAYKIHPAFYGEHREHGERALSNTLKHIRRYAPTVPVIIDGKYGDPSYRTNEKFAETTFERYHADAITINPLPGRDALMPFLRHKNKGIFVVCRTSNPGAGEFQDLLINGEPLYRRIAVHVARDWNEHGNCGLVVGATYPNELEEIRSAAHNIPLLAPGIGTQGGNVERAIAASKAKLGKIIILTESSSIIFASKEEDFAEAAKHKVYARNQEIARCL